MNLFAIGVTLFIVFMLIIILRGLFSRSRDESNGFYQVPYEDRQHDSFGIFPAAQGTSLDGGDWGGSDSGAGDAGSGAGGGN